MWPLFEQTRIPFTQGCFVPSLLENGPMVLEKIFGFGQCIFAISQLSPLGKGHGPLFEQTINRISFTQECFVPSLVEIGPMVLEKKVLNFISVFPLFRNYLPLEKGAALLLNKFESPSPEDVLSQVWKELAK